MEAAPEQRFGGVQSCVMRVAVCRQPRLHGLEHRSLQDGRMLGCKAPALVVHLAEIDAVGEHLMQGAGGERQATADLA